MRKLIVIGLLLFSKRSDADSSLTFTGGDADTVIVTTTSIVNNANPVSYLIWFNATTIVPAANRNIISKGTGGARIVLYMNTATTEVRMEYANAALGQARVLNTSLPNYGASKWVFMAVTWHVGTASPRMYTGDLNHTALEATAYAVQATGTAGSHDDTNGFLNVGNVGAAPGAASNSFPGDIAFFQQINRYLTLAEIQELQFNPRIVADTVVFQYIGFNGTGTQYDLTGLGHNGTVTGATASSAGAPIFIGGGVP